jgi:hypothetical protein
VKAREGVAQEMTNYHVQVTREGGQWLADVPELEGTQTYAASLTALDRHVREAIVLGADLPDDAMSSLELTWTYDIGNQLSKRAAAIRAERATLAAKEKKLDQATRELAAELTEEGYSVRDTGPLLGISHQRVSQLNSHRSIRQKATSQEVVSSSPTGKRRLPKKPEARAGRSDSDVSG